jgi:hypothetical protein
MSWSEKHERIRGDWQVKSSHINGGLPAGTPAGTVRTIMYETRCDSENSSV